LRLSNTRIGLGDIHYGYIDQLIKKYLTTINQTQRAQREDNFSFAVERTAKKLLSSFAA
jgi:hypothetical protein